MTDEQFTVMAHFEELFDRALKNKPKAGDYPGRAAMEAMVSVIKSARPHYRTNLNCRTCVLHTIQDAARMYFGEKELREKETEPKPDKAKKATKKNKAEE